MVYVTAPLKVNIDDGQLIVVFVRLAVVAVKSEPVVPAEIVVYAATVPVVVSAPKAVT